MQQHWRQFRCANVCSLRACGRTPDSRRKSHAHKTFRASDARHAQSPASHTEVVPVARHCKAMTSAPMRPTRSTYTTNEPPWTIWGPHVRARTKLAPTTAASEAHREDNGHAEAYGPLPSTFQTAASALSAQPGNTTLGPCPGPVRLSAKGLGRAVASPPERPRSNAKMRARHALASTGLAPRTRQPPLNPRPCSPPSSPPTHRLDLSSQQHLAPRLTRPPAALAPTCSSQYHEALSAFRAQKAAQWSAQPAPRLGAAAGPSPLLPSS